VSLFQISRTLYTYWYGCNIWQLHDYFLFHGSCLKYMRDILLYLQSRHLLPS
jgi:hypothetical protein